MQIYDLSHPIASGMPVFPGTPNPIVIPIASLNKDGFLEHCLSLSTHTGTHVDAPAHVLPQGKSIDVLPCEAFCGSACVLDCRQARDGCITLEFLEDLDCLANPVDFVLMYTGWDGFWGQKGYYSGFPILTFEAANWLAGFPLKGVGVDTPSIDPVDSLDLAAHHALLENEILIIENLTNLDRLPGEGCTFCCLPLYLEHGDGSPVRAVGIVGA
ncbi:MAG: cyclase family protein [Desulfatibacillum sp.]|nr:cyclase family protein [Desulfatibacillum sp.]